MKAPKKRTSNKTCPQCGDRGIKIYNLTQGLYRCQNCEHKYEWEKSLKSNPIFG